MPQGEDMHLLDICAEFLAAGCLMTLVGCGQTPSDSAQPSVAELRSELDYSPGAGWNLAWSDEFDGTGLNGGAWTALTSNFDPVTNNCNFGTGELEFPRAQNVVVGGGVLSLKAQRTGDNPSDSRCTGYGGRAFYSGRIHTKGKVEGRYGKIVASIKVPSGYGMWPAFWTLGADISTSGWPSCGEIDIVEWTANEPTWMKSAVHWYHGGQADWGTGESGKALSRRTVERSRRAPPSGRERVVRGGFARSYHARARRTAHQHDAALGAGYII